MLKSCEQLLCDARSRVREIDWGDLDEDGLAGALLVDVREPQEVKQRAVPGAIHIPRGLLEFNIDSHPELKHLGERALLDSPVALFCGTGGRSALAARTLEDLGFRQVYSVRGGVQQLDQGS